MGNSVKNNQDFSSIFDQALNGTTVVQPPPKKTTHQQQTQLKPKTTNGFDFSSTFDESLKKKVGGSESSNGVSQLPLQKGLIEKGNIDLYAQPSIPNPEKGGMSTVFATSFGTDKGEVLVSRVTPDGKFLSEKEALDYYKRTGKHLGIFKTPQDATAYSQQLHDDYAAGKFTPEEKINAASLNYQNKNLKPEDVKTLADTDFGYAKGWMKLTTPDDLKHLTDVHNSTPTPDEVDNKVKTYVDNFLPDINPIDAKKYAQQEFAGQVTKRATQQNISDQTQNKIPLPAGINIAQTKPVIFTDEAAAEKENQKVKKEMVDGIKSGDIKQIATFRNLSTEKINKQIDEINKNPNGILTSTGISSAGISDSKIELSDEQKQQIKNFQQQKDDIEKTLSGYVDNSLVQQAYKKVGGLRSHDNLLEIGKQKRQYEEPTPQFEGEQEVSNPLAKTFQNYDDKQKGIDAAINALSMDYAANYKAALADTDVSAKDRVKDNSELINDLIATKANLPNEYLPVQVNYVSRLMGDKISSFHPVLNVFITDADRQKAIEELEKENPGFTQKYSTAIKYINDNGGVETNIPHQGFIGAFNRGGTEATEGIENSVKDFFGFRNRGDRAADELINQYSAYGSGTSFAGRTPDKIIVDKEGLAFKQIPNENYGKTNFNTVFNGLGEFTGGIIPFALLTEGVGELGGVIGKAAKTPLSKSLQSKIGVTGATYLMNYDHNLEQADKLILDNTGAGDFKRGMVANLMTIGQAAAFNIMPANEFIRNNFTVNLAKDAAKFVEGNTLQNGLNKEALAKWLDDIVKPRTLASLKIAGVETAQNVGKLDAAMLLQNHSNAIVGSLFDETGQTKNNDVIQQDIQTLKDATLGGLFFGLPKLVHAPFSMTARDALYDHAQNADENIARINELQSKGLIAPEQANGIIKLINTARKNLDALTNTNEKGLPTSLRQRKIQLAELVRKDVLDEIKKENPNATEQSEGSIKNADENIKTVINETPYIDLSKLPIMEELKNKYGITNPLDIDPRIEYEINGKDISGEDILSQIQNSNNESSETSKLIQTANEQDQSKQQASLNQGNGKTVNLEGNGNKQSGNEKEIGLLEEAKRLSDDVQGLYSGAFKKDPARALFEAATQLNSSESEAKTARSIFGERLSKIALELFPNAKVGDVYESKTTEITPEKGITGSAKDNEQLGKSSIEIKQAEKVDGEDLQSQQETNVEWLDKNKNNFTQIEYSRLNEGLANNDADINKEVRSLRKEQSTKPTSTTETIHTENIKNKFREQFKAKGNTDEHIDAAIALMDARSKSWASEEKGRTPEQWFDRIADVKNGEFETGDVQYQKGGLKATLTGAMSLASVHATDLANRVEPRLANEKKVAFADEYEIPVYDNRKVDATSGKPVTDKNNQYSNVNAGVAKEIVRAANKHGVDPYTAIAMGIQETGFAGDGLDNPLHILFEKANVGKSENVIDASMRILKEKIDYAKKLGKKSEEEILQAWNGYGKIGKLTAAAEEGANINAWYGVDATKGNLDMSKNPLYGKRIVDIRENIVKKNPELVKLIEGEKKNIAYQEQSGVKHGALETLKDGRVIIHALDAPDVSTMVHEIGHIFEKDLTEAEQKIVKEFGGSEPFARGFERYLRDGKSPTPELKTLFDKFKQWLTDIYQSLKGSPIAKKISPEIKQIFDRLLTEQENKKADKTQTENIGIAAKGKELADKIRQLKTKQDKLQTSIFGIPIAIYDGAIETVATAIEKGSELAEAIQKGIEFIGKKAGFDEESFRKHIEDFSAGDKPKIKVQLTGEGEPPKPPTSTTESFADNPNKSERTRGAYDHLLDSKIDEDVKQKFRDNGIKYKIAKNESAQKIGRSMIDAYGTDEALKLARLNTFHASVNSAVFAEAINDYYNKERLVKNPQEKFDAAARWADTYNEYAELLTAAGQFSQYAYNFYKTSPLGFILSAKERLDERRKYFVAKDEKSLREAFEAFKDIPEFRDLFSQEVSEAAKKVKREVKAADRQKIKDAWDKLKLDKNTTYATLVPPPIINGAIEVMKQAHLLGYEVSDILKEGIKYINERHKEGWDEKKFKSDFTPIVENLLNETTTHKSRLEFYKDSLKKQIDSLDKQIENKQREAKKNNKIELDDEAKNLIEQRDEKRKQLNEVVPPQKTAEDILKKWDKKLTKLEPAARKELLTKVLNEIVKNGGLEYDRFKEMYADALGLPSLTPTMEAKLHELGNKLNEVDIARENLDKNPTQENIDAFKKAMREGTAASTQINDLLGDKGITLDRFLSIAKLNTLGIANLFVNPFFNVWFMPIRFLESLTKMGLDYGLKYAGFERADGIYENTFYKQRGYLKGFLGGSSKAVRNIYTGDAQFDYFQKSSRQNIQPLSSFKEIIAHHKGEKKLTNAEYANAVMEALPTMGGTAAIISRGLQLGDLPFRFAAEVAMAENIAFQKGLSGVAKEAFVLSPDEVSAEKIRDAGQRAVLAQDNGLTKLLNNVSVYFKNVTKENPAGAIGVGIIKIVGATTQPFLKIPLNSAITAFELAVPEFSLLKGIYYTLKSQGAFRGINIHASESDRDLALNAFSRAVVGLAIGMAASQIAKAGLITTTSGDEKKIGTSIYQGDIVGNQSLNYTGFKRWLRGGNPEFADGDVTVNLNWMGIPGAIMQMYGQKNDEMTAEQWDKQGYLANLWERMDGSFVNGLKNNVFGNTSTLLQAMDNGSPYFVNKWLRGSSNVLANAFDPSWLSTASKISDKYKADYSAMNLGEQMSATLKERFWNGDSLPKQITVWGEKRTDAPKGTNPFLYYYADITKHRNVDTKDFGYNILALYNRTKQDDAIPSRPSKTFQHNKRFMSLDPKQYEEYQIMVGQNRKQLVQAAMNTDVWNVSSDAEKVGYLDKIYKSGASIGKAEFFMKHPELDLPQTEEKK